jgi:hypothetical protein
MPSHASDRETTPIQPNTLEPTAVDVVREDARRAIDNTAIQNRLTSFLKTLDKFNSIADDISAVCQCFYATIADL